MLSALFIFAVIVLLHSKLSETAERPYQDFGSIYGHGIACLLVSMSISFYGCNLEEWDAYSIKASVVKYIL